MHGGQNDIDELYSDEWKNHAADTPDQKVLAQQRVGTERLILDAFEGNRNQGRDDDGVENVPRTGSRTSANEDA